MTDIHSCWESLGEIINDLQVFQEKSYFECKKAENKLPKDFWSSYSAFSNTHGGIILLGISEQNGRFSVSGIQDPQKIIDDMFSQMRGGEKISINSLSNSDVQVIPANSTNIIAVRVKKADNNAIPVYLHRDIRSSYIRLNTGDHKLTENELKNLLSGYTKNNQDSKVIPNTGLNEINLFTLKRYREL